MAVQVESQDKGAAPEPLRYLHRCSPTDRWSTANICRRSWSVLPRWRARPSSRGGSPVPNRLQCGPEDRFIEPSHRQRLRPVRRNRVSPPSLGTRRRSFATARVVGSILLRRGGSQPNSPRACPPAKAATVQFAGTSWTLTKNSVGPRPDVAGQAPVTTVHPATPVTASATPMPNRQPARPPHQDGQPCPGCEGLWYGGPRPQPGWVSTPPLAIGRPFRRPPRLSCFRICEYPLSLVVWVICRVVQASRSRRWKRARHTC